MNFVLNFISFWKYLSILQMGVLVLVPTFITLGIITILSIRKKSKNKKNSKTQLAEKAEQWFNPETYTVNTEEISRYDGLKPQKNKHEIDELEERMRLKQSNELKNLVREKQEMQKPIKNETEEVSSEKYLLKAKEKESDFETAKKYIQKAYKIEKNENEQIRIKVIYKNFTQNRESLTELYKKYPSFYKLENLPVINDFLEKSKEEEQTMDFETSPKKVSFEPYQKEKQTIDFETSPEKISFEPYQKDEQTMNFETSPEKVSFEPYQKDEQTMDFETSPEKVSFEPYQKDEQTMDFETSPEKVSFEPYKKEEQTMDFETSPEKVSFEPYKKEESTLENKVLASFLSKESSSVSLNEEPKHIESIEIEKEDVEVVLEQMNQEEKTEQNEQISFDNKMDSLLEELGGLGKQIQEESKNSFISETEMNPTKKEKVERSKIVWANWMFGYAGKNNMRNVIFDLDVPWGSKKSVENLTQKIYEHMSKEFSQELNPTVCQIVMISVEELTE